MRPTRVRVPVMRLLKTLLAAVVVLALAGTALAATTRKSVTAHMRGTTHVAKGGVLKLTVSQKTHGPKFGVTIHYDVNVKSPTVIKFAAYPCRYATCAGNSVGTSGKLSARVHHITFTGRVPVNRIGSSNTACVFAQLHDLGPKGKEPGTVIKHTKHTRGVRLCRKVS
jgi:hypothetical protein